jgi:hypothetical protein
MLKHRLITPTHKESLLIQLGLKPIPESVIKECTKLDKPDISSELRIKYQPYASEAIAKLYADIAELIGADIGISCSEVYKQLANDHKIPMSSRKGIVPMPYNTFVRYFYDAHRVSGVKIPSKIEKAYRLVLKGYADDVIASVAGVHASSAKRIKILLGYPGYVGKVYDKEFKSAVAQAIKRIGKNNHQKAA